MSGFYGAASLETEYKTELIMAYFMALWQNGYERKWHPPVRASPRALYLESYGASSAPPKGRIASAKSKPGPVDGHRAAPGQPSDQG